MFVFHTNPWSAHVFSLSCMDWIIPRHQADYSQHTRCDFARDLFTGVVTNISLSCKWLDLYWRASAVFMIPTGATNTLHTTQTVGGRNAKKVNFYCLLVWGISQPWFFGNKIAWFFRRLQKCVVMLIWSLLRFPLIGIYEHETNKCVFWYLCIWVWGGLVEVELPIILSNDYY